MQDIKSIQLLKKQKIAFQIQEYPKELRDTTLIAEASGVPAEQNFKSLVLIDREEHPLIVMLPSNSRLDMDRLAEVLGKSRLQLATPTQAEKITGLQVGGISPLALADKGLPIFIDQSVNFFDQVMLSAGQRGVAIKLAVDDLIKVTKAQFLAL